MLFSELTLAQHDYFAPIQFNCQLGKTEQHAGGLSVSVTLANQKTVSVPQAGLENNTSYDKNVFSVFFTITNNGPDEVLISDWVFRAICPENNMGLAWQEHSSVPLVAAYVPFDQYLVLAPGDKRSFFSAETDFYWCLPKNQSALMTSPQYVSVVIICVKRAVANVAATPSGSTNTTQQQKNSPLDQTFVDMIESVKKAYAAGDSAKAEALKTEVLELAGHVYPDRLTEIGEMMSPPVVKKAQPVAAAPNPSAASPSNIKTAEHGGNYSDWLFMNSDKAVQVRYMLEKTEGDIGYFSVQFRVNHDDAIFCTYPNCEGYIATFSYPTPDNQTSVYHHLKIYNSYRQIYTLPELMPLRMHFADGSKRMLLKQGFFYTTAQNPNPMPADTMFYNCVDNILSDDPKNRCTRGGWRDIYKESEAIILK
ncbi:hypothetical protein [Flavobacterium caeni]|uniref:Uncharacterized protein n=1 Tax=Flavobacterium caeni TaxID=490189 RepID=A0A1G5I812_9FLAO|nr:hypothetical protein [Flavobacterium caeni]SCY72107.1 hypothetical protein SAMN02927903_02151 [Flavobacterium caeni]